jgi:hypothetical protein
MCVRACVCLRVYVFVSGASERVMRSLTSSIDANRGYWLHLMIGVDAALGTA